MKIALACVPVVNGNIEHNSACILQAMEACAGKADLVVFGESVLQGFDSLTWEYDLDCRIAVSVTDDPIIRICRAAKQIGIAVSFGYIEKDGSSLFSSQIVIDAFGSIIHNFRRVSKG